MATKRFLTVFILLSITTQIFAGEIITFRLSDGETVDGKLSLPSGSKNVRELIIYVHGTGPSTYDNPRGSRADKFNYFDYFAKEFNRRGIGFFTYNKRGVTIGDEPPFYEKVDRQKFRKAVPSVEVRDLATYIKTLRQAKRLKKTRIVLLGWSEGTILAAMAALFLNGDVHDNMYDVIKWQNAGGSSMVNLRAAFDKDKDGSISRDEYESVDRSAVAMRNGGLLGAKFEQIDVNRDGVIDAVDFTIIVGPRYRQILAAYERGDEDWIWANYFRVSLSWLKEHFVLEANKDRLLRLRIPIYVFHGEDDANCPVEGVYDLRRRFDKAGKNNLEERVFAGLNHDLNFADWITKKKMSEGIRKMFEVAETVSK